MCLLLKQSIALATENTKKPSPPEASTEEHIEIDPSDRLVHPIVRGKIGPWQMAEVWLTGSKNIEDPPFKGFVLIKDTKGNKTTYALPRPDQSEDFYMMKVLSVIFQPTEKYSNPSLIVIYSTARIGPQQPTTFGSIVYQWDKTKFIRNNRIESKLINMKNSTEVIHRLKK